MEFNKWLDTLVEEKGIDLEDTFEFTRDGVWNLMPYGVVIEHIKIATKDEQKAIQEMLVKIDVLNGDVTHFFRHLGPALA